ncbi:prolyl-tRNA synthetase [bacterium]|nr:prolyl-tRNA synthetase [bacterium]|tara:strand:- start:6924 stop:8198 length:1275 start_codon:yes stop_codon:yes gene_type:complete
MTHTIRQSVLFTKTRKDTPKDEVSKNAQLLIRAGYIHKEMAGVYSLLPLGLRTFNNVVQVIREEMDAIGGQEMIMTALQDPEVWKTSGRWEDTAVDIWFKTHLHSGEQYHEGAELGIANTHEEPLTRMLKDHISSYKDLPKFIYQFQTKFRNETRAKSGIMRTREFVMKDLYSFNTDEKSFREFYEKCAEAYLRIFNRIGIGEKTYRTFASGGSFSRFSDEFQTISDAGEDMIYINDTTGTALNKEVNTTEVIKDLGWEGVSLREERAIEVGNIFPLGTRFSDAIGLTYKNEEGEELPVVMGSYGIGPARAMGTVAEVLSDERGLVWPEEIAPFKYHLVVLDNGTEEVRKEAERLFREMESRSMSVLFDDRDVRVGEKFADSDLIGIPKRVIVSEKTLAAGEYELVTRATGATTYIREQELLDN